MNNEQNPKSKKPKLQTSNHLTTQQPNHLFGNQKSAIKNPKFCVRIPAVLCPPPSSSGLGRGPFKAKTGVRISVGAPEKKRATEI